MSSRVARRVVGMSVKCGAGEDDEDELNEEEEGAQRMCILKPPFNR